jgi:hypothetical protein
MQGNVAPAFRNIFILAVDFALLLSKDPKMDGRDLDWWYGQGCIR